MRVRVNESNKEKLIDVGVTDRRKKFLITIYNSLRPDSESMST